MSHYNFMKWIVVQNQPKVESSTDYKATNSTLITLLPCFVFYLIQIMFISLATVNKNIWWSTTCLVGIDYYQKDSIDLSNFSWNLILQLRCLVIFYCIFPNSTSDKSICQSNNFNIFSHEVLPFYCAMLWL